GCPSIVCRKRRLTARGLTRFCADAQQTISKSAHCGRRQYVSTNAAGAPAQRVLRLFTEKPSVGGWPGLSARRQPAATPRPTVRQRQKPGSSSWFPVPWLIAVRQPVVQRPHQGGQHLRPSRV